MAVKGPRYSLETALDYFRISRIRQQTTDGGPANAISFFQE